MAPVRKTRKEPTRRSERLELSKAIEASKKNLKIQIKAPVTPIRKSFRRPKQHKTCRFLQLPGELRNQIYRYALVSDKAIEITPTGPGEPPLLSTCVTIRRETKGIYYPENDFRLLLTDYNGAAFSDFYWQSRLWQFRRHSTAKNITFQLGGRPNWANLVEWIKDGYYGCGPPLRPDLDEPKCRDDHVVGAAFRIAEELEFQVCWVTIEKALEAYHWGLKGTCSRWARDGESGH
ncbi:hypothetical protein D0863_01938 [Hortaea werneckii]|uniref:Uncharacterized protein n=1 Tax=Hortaea werneckii TaxID=91943 RepID=A0A3M7EIM2_HORWE|nr:hypothetical protein D0863_01938 [Hortaea werneckii]